MHHSVDSTNALRAAYRLCLCSQPQVPSPKMVVWGQGQHAGNIRPNQKLAKNVAWYTRSQRARLFYLISGSTDRRVVSWNPTTGRPIRILRLDRHTQGIGSIAIAPNGLTAASGAWDGNILLWDLQVDELIGSFVGHRAPVISLAFDQQSHFLLSGAKDSTVRLWDIRGPTQLQQFSIGQRLTNASTIDTTKNLVLMPAHQLGFSGALGIALVWRLDSGAIIDRFDLNSGADVVRNALRFQIKAHDPNVGQEDGDGIANVALSIRNDANEQVYYHQENLAAYCAFGGDSDSCDPLSMAAADYRWPSSDGQQERGPAIESGAYTLHAVINASDGTSATVTSKLAIQLPTPKASAPLWTASPVSGTGTISITPGSPLVIELIQGEAPRNRLSAVAMDSTGQRALVSDDNNLISWDRSSGEKRLFARGHTQRILRIAYHEAQGRAFSVAADGMVIAWDLQTGQPLWQRQLPHESTLWDLAITEDGSRAVAGYEDHSVILWDLETGQELQQYVGHQDAVYAVALSTDEQAILTGAADRRLILWDLAGGEERRRFEGHSLPVRAVAFSADSKTVLSGSEDRTVRLWDRTTGAERFRFTGQASPIQNALYLPGDTQILTRAEDGALHLWQMPTLESQFLRAWTEENRYVRALTCDERLLYLGETSCNRAATSE